MTIRRRMTVQMTAESHAPAREHSSRRLSVNAMFSKFPTSLIPSSLLFQKPWYWV